MLAAKRTEQGTDSGLFGPFHDGLEGELRAIIAAVGGVSGLLVFELRSVPHFTTLQKVSKRLLRFATTGRLLDMTLETIGPDRYVALAAMDSTGLEVHHVSRYFVSRRRSKELSGREDTYFRRWPRLAVLCDCRTHAILLVIAACGPGVDTNQFGKILKPATEKVRIDRLLATPATTAKPIIVTRVTAITLRRSSRPNMVDRRRSCQGRRTGVAWEPTSRGDSTASAGKSRPSSA